MARPKQIITDLEHLVYTNKYVRVYDNQVTFPSNVKGRYLKFDWTAPYSVGVLPVLEDGRLYLVRSFRYASDEISIEIPKGYGSEGVAPADVAIRELGEETGLSSNNLRHLASLQTDAAIMNHLTHLFEARGCRPAFTSRPEETEVFESPIIVAPDEAIALVRSNTITDSVTVNALLFFYCSIFYDK